MSDQWIRLAEFLFLIIGFAFALWKAWVKLNEKVSGFGRRVKAVEENCAANGKDLEGVLREQAQARIERSDIRAMAVENRTKVETLRQEIADDRLAIMSTLHANEKAAAERNAELREKLGRLDERLNIQAMVRQVVREFKEP